MQQRKFGERGRGEKKWSSQRKKIGERGRAFEKLEERKKKGNRK